MKEKSGTVSVTSKNQPIAPPKKSTRVDNLGNEDRRLWLTAGSKKDKTTMLFLSKHNMQEGRHLTKGKIKWLINYLNSGLMQIGAKPMDKRFLDTQ